MFAGGTVFRSHVAMTVHAPRLHHATPYVCTPDRIVIGQSLVCPGTTMVSSGFACQSVFRPSCPLLVPFTSCPSMTRWRPTVMLYAQAPPRVGGRPVFGSTCPGSRGSFWAWSRSPSTRTRGMLYPRRLPKQSVAGKRWCRMHRLWPWLALGDHVTQSGSIVSSTPALTIRT